MSQRRFYIFCLSNKWLAIRLISTYVDGPDVFLLIICHISALNISTFVNSALA